jgi:hypothetical protein
MTITSILNQVHEVYEGSTDYPVAGEDDFDLRLALLVGGIRQWADEPVNWRELYTTLSDQGSGTGTGTKVTTAGTTSYATPTNFVRPSSYVKVGDAYYGFSRLDTTTNTQRLDANSPYFTISGTPQAYKIGINPAPAESDLTIAYPYYREPTIPTLGTQTPEVPRPLYLVYHVLARLYEQDNRNDLVSFYESKQDEQRQLMVVENLKKPADHPNTIPDIGNRLYGSGFGL